MKKKAKIPSTTIFSSKNFLKFPYEDLSSHIERGI
jgi:hypothetical protein